MLDKFADGLDQYAEDFSKALRDSDITKLKRLAHSFRGVSQQFGAIHAAGLAISISAASTAAEAQPLVTRLLEGFTGLKKSIQAYRIYTALPDRRTARERRRRLI